MNTVNSKIEHCPIYAIQQKLGGKYKFLILWVLQDESKRFKELQRCLGDLTQSTLTKQLRELEADGLVKRFVYHEIPPKVEYSLTDLGKSFLPILESMKDWGAKHLS